jgi:hypothetical protein
MGFGVRLARLIAEHKENPACRPGNCAEPLGISNKCGISHCIAEKIDFQEQADV